MQDRNEHHIDDDPVYKPEVVEVEHDKKPADKMVSLIDLDAIFRDEMDKLLNPPIAEA